MSPEETARVEARLASLLEMIAEDAEDEGIAPAFGIAVSSDELSHFMAGTELSKLRRFAEAAPHFRQVIALDASYSAAYRGLGRALLFLERPDDARAILTDGIEIADAAGDLQTVREMQAFLNKIDRMETP